MLLAGVRADTFTIDKSASAASFNGLVEVGIVKSKYRRMLFPTCIEMTIVKVDSCCQLVALPFSDQRVQPQKRAPRVLELKRDLCLFAGPHQVVHAPQETTGADDTRQVLA